METLTHATQTDVDRDEAVVEQPVPTTQAEATTTPPGVSAGTQTPESPPPAFKHVSVREIGEIFLHFATPFVVGGTLGGRPF